MPLGVAPVACGDDVVFGIETAVLAREQMFSGAPQVPGLRGGDAQGARECLAMVLPHGHGAVMAAPFLEGKGLASKSGNEMGHEDSTC